MALVDGDYKFTWEEVGANGTSSDAQIFKDCDLKAAIDQRERWRLQDYLGGSWCKWYFIGCADIQRLWPEGSD